MGIHFSHTNAVKKPTNLSINRELLQEARKYKINLSQTLEQSLIEILREIKRHEWLEENRQSIEEYNQRVLNNGVFSDGLRSF